MDKLKLDAFKLKANQENNILDNDLIGGTQGNCHVSTSGSGVFAFTDRNGNGNNPN